MNSRRMTPVLCLALSGVCVLQVWGQSVEDFLEVNIKSIEAKAIRAQDEGPKVLDMPVDNRSTWVRLTVEYELAFDTKGRTFNGDKNELWADELSFDWIVILPRSTRGREPRERDSVRMTKKVTYGNVQVGDKKLAVLYIDPKTWARYNEAMPARDAIFATARVRIGTRTKAQFWAAGKSFVTSESKSAALFPKTRGSWFESEELKRLSSGLLCRLQTPWQFSSYGFYESIVSCDDRER